MMLCTVLESAQSGTPQEIPEALFSLEPLPFPVPWHVNKVHVSNGERLFEPLENPFRVVQTEISQGDVANMTTSPGGTLRITGARTSVRRLLDGVGLLPILGEGL
jgi:hypothetical protein